MNNRWRHGPAHFEIFPLDDYIGMRDGCFPLPVVLDPEIGEEVALFIRDQTPFMEQLCRINPFRLMLKPGCARNQYGPLVFFLFWVRDPANPDQPFASWDCYLNPKNDEMLGLWRSLASQTHWHVFLVGEAGEQRNFLEFENTFDLRERLDFLEEACREVPTIDFNRARQTFMDEHTLKDLFNLPA